MNELLEKIEKLESEMKGHEDAAEYWIDQDNLEKSSKYEQLADKVYEKLYKLLDQAADRIVSITSGQIDKVTAKMMIRCRRSEVKRIFHT